MWCAIDLCLLVVSGYALAAGLAGRASRLEIAALTLCIGPGVIGFSLLILSMLGLRPSRIEILILCGAFAVAGIAVWKTSRFEAERNSGAARIPSWWIVICFCAIGYGFLSIAVDALYYPIVEWDAFAIWQLKAQVLAIFPLHPLPGYFTDLALSYSHLRYPLLAPMMSAQMHAMTGRIDDLSKTVSLLFYPGMCLAVFAAVRRVTGSFAAITVTALLACAEPICRYGGTGTAELPLTAFYACSLLCMLRWRENRQIGYLILTAILSGWMAWTKNEGVALAAINAIVIAFSGPRDLRRQSLAAAAGFTAIVAIIYLPWIIFSWGLPRSDEDYAGRFASLQLLHSFGRLGRIFLGIGQGLIDWENWGIFWIILLMLAIVERWQFKNPRAAFIGVLLLLHILAYVPAFMVTNWKLDELFGVTIDRLLMHAAPAAAILMGFLWPIWAGRTDPTA